jgi:acyl-CoA thioesterase FadM
MRVQTSTISGVPTHAYTTSVSVRSYETSSAGVIAPATLLRYLEHVATLDSAARGFDHTWYERSGSAWVVREMRLLLWDAPALAEEIRLATWLSRYRRVQATREYCVWSEPAQRLVARAQGRWAYIERERGLPLRVPDEMSGRFGAMDYPMPAEPSAHPKGSGQTSTSEIMLVARAYEADTQRHINNTIYLDWLGEALALALQGQAPPGSPPSMTLSDLTPRRCHIQYMRPAQPGDHLRVITQSGWTGSRRLAVWQEIRDDVTGQPVVECRSEYLRRKP